MLSLQSLAARSYGSHLSQRSFRSESLFVPTSTETRPARCVVGLESGERDVLEAVDTAAYSATVRIQHSANQTTMGTRLKEEEGTDANGQEAFILSIVLLNNSAGVLLQG